MVCPLYDGSLDELAQRQSAPIANAPDRRGDALRTFHGVLWGEAGLAQWHLQVSDAPADDVGPRPVLPVAFRSQKSGARMAALTSALDSSRGASWCSGNDRPGNARTANTRVRTSLGPPRSGPRPRCQGAHKDGGSLERASGHSSPENRPLTTPNVLAAHGPGGGTPNKLGVDRLRRSTGNRDPLPSCTRHPLFSRVEISPMSAPGL